MIRWTPRRKAQVVADVRTCKMSLQDACERYGLTATEYKAWEEAVNTHGLPALRVTYTQQYRSAL